MDYTYLDYFNYYLREFLNEILVKYPELKNNILGNYRDLLEGKMVRVICMLSTTIVKLTIILYKIRLKKE